MNPERPQEQRGVQFLASLQQAVSGAVVGVELPLRRSRLDGVRALLTRS